MNVFQRYADYYDILYRDKNYRKECLFVEKIFKKYSKKKLLSVLDLGCGTGNHALILAERGYKVTGVDLSKVMVDIAKNKVKERKAKIDFRVGDMRKINLNKKFDAVISMFAAVGYQVKNSDLISTFLAANRHLKKGGIFIFDCWFGPAVLWQKPSRRIKIVRKGREKIARYATPVLDIINQVVNVHFKIIVKSKNRVLKNFREVHKVRFLFAQEIEHFFEMTGFKLLKICPFLKIKTIPTQRDWNIAVIAKKV